MFSNIKYSVVVLLDGDIFGVWELPGKPEHSEQYAIRKAVKDAVLNIGALLDDVFTVQFTETLVSDNVTELIAGLKESIENHIGYG